jgi:hypothetical protein
MEPELTLAILSPTESHLDFLNPEYLDIEEVNELFKLRTITLTHPLFDEDGTDLTRYDSILIAGNKIWRQSTNDGDSCLYVITGPKSYDFQSLTVTVEAVEAAVELSQYTIYRSSAFSWTINSTDRGLCYR